MKRILQFALLMLCSSVYGQKVALQTAINRLNYDDLDKAKESIDQAAAHESTINMSKTWYYRGQIYHAIYESEKDQFASLKPGSLQQAFESYEKALELDTKKEYADDLNKRLIILSSQMQNEGVDQYRDKKYAEALGSFEKAIKISEKYLKVTDTLAVYNAALAAEKSGNVEKAKEYYNKVIALNHGGAKVFGMLSSLQLAQKDTSGALETLQRAKAKYPGDADLAITELNIYLGSGRDKEAATQIEAAITNDPNNASLYFAKGVLNDRLGKTETAVEAYQKAIEINPGHFDANYNLGAMLFNDAAELINKANNLPASKQKEYEEAKAKADARFKQAMPYFEKAYAINPKDMATLQSLRQVYVRLNMKEKEAEIKKAMDSAQ